MHENCKNTTLAKTLKISLPSRRNAYFQEIEDKTNQKNQAKNDAKLHVFEDLDFGRIWGGFWEGLGTPKPTKTPPKSHKNRIKIKA